MFIFLFHDYSMWVLRLLMLSFVCGLDVGVTPTRFDLWSIGDGYFPCYRQPVIISASDDGQTLIAFTEGRVNFNATTCGPPASLLSSIPNEVGGLIQRKSSDGGNSWGKIQTIYGGTSKTSPNMDYFSVVRDESNDMLWIFLQIRSVVQIFTSGDAGEKWDGPFKLNVTAPPSFKIVAPTVGHGIQIKNTLCLIPEGCIEAGRLVVPFVCKDNKDNKGTTHSCTLLSDDHGKSWYIGGFGQKGSRESAIVQTISSSSTSTLYINERNMGKTPGHRLVAHSKDGGGTFCDFKVDSNLTSPVTPHWTGIVGSVIRATLSGVDQQTEEYILYSGVIETNARVGLAIHVSVDEGISWKSTHLLWSGPAAYSDLVRINATHVGIVFEAGNITFADRIQFSAIPIQWLTHSGATNSWFSHEIDN